MKKKRISIKKGSIKIEFFYILLSIIFTFCIIASSNIFSNKATLKVGDISSESYFAPFQVENDIATERKRQAIELSVEDIYVTNPAILEESLEKINQFFNVLLEVYDKDLPLDQNNLDLIRKDNDSKINLIKMKSPLSLKDDVIELMLNMSKENIIALKDTVLNLSQDLLESGIQVNENISYRIRSAIENTSLNLVEQTIAYEIMSLQLKPNLVLDEQATEAERKRIRDQVEPVIVLKGERIISEGTRITEESYALLKKVGYIKEESLSFNQLQYVGLFLLIVMVATLFIYYMKSKKSLNHLNDKELSFIFLVYMLSLIMIGLFGKRLSLFLPLSLGPMILAILMRKDLAVMIHLILVIVTTMISKGESIFFIYMMLSGLMNIYIIGDIKHRNKTMINAFIIGIVHSILFVSISLAVGIPIESSMLIQIIQIFVLGILQVLLVIGSLPIWEMCFGFVTPIRLLELTNPDQPIMKKMLIEATGTYYHSLLIANLAEAAADEIGADPLLTRVGGYYHDIGKLHSSNYFKENQIFENPHDRMDPLKSAECILSHVTSGIDLANEIQLPICIRDIIQQHHGDSLVQYFYIKAKEINPDIEKEKFQYIGPKPQTKEAALIMLADISEATVRSMQHKIGKDLTIEDIIRKIIKQKLEEGQLDECPLYISDIEKIIGTFSKMLKGMYHERIEYPEDHKKKTE